MLAVDVVDEKVGVQYFVVHCECACAHRNGYRVVCELGTIETFGGSGGLLAIVEGDALLGAVIDGGEGEAGYQAATGNATISRGLNIMDSISNDFSHLSVGDLLASSEPSAPPALNRISLESDTFTDDDHNLLDSQIMDVFNIFRRYNEEPVLSDLLSRVTMDNVRLTMLTPNQAEELLDREPSIAGLLRNGWQAGSFKEVRQLGVFPICSTSTF